MTSTTALLGYAQPWVAHPGETVEFKVSSNGPRTCDLTIFRIVCADIDPNGPGAEFEKQSWGEASALSVHHQVTDAGSYVTARLAPDLDPADGVDLALLIFPTLRTGTLQVLFSFGALSLHISPDGRLGAIAGDTSVILDTPIELRQWHRVHLCIDAGRLSLTAEHTRPRPDVPARQRAHASVSDFDWPDADTPLLFAAEPHDSSSRGTTRHHYNGKIEAPRLATAKGDLLAAWNFARDQGAARVYDLGPHGCTLDLHNTPMRGATGHLWNGSAEHWNLNEAHYAAIHFHDDDTTDCRWETTCSVGVPADARPGFYMARLTADGVESDISFFVSVETGKPRSKILFLVPTATYQAYANTHIKFDSANTENLYEAPMALSEDELYLNIHRELGLSLYDTHSDDSGVIFAGTRRPMLNTRPGLYTFNYVNDTHIVKGSVSEVYAWAADCCGEAGPRRCPPDHADEMEPSQIAVQVLRGDAAIAAQETLQLAVAAIDRLNVEGIPDPLSGRKVQGFVANAHGRSAGRIAAMTVRNQNDVGIQNRFEHRLQGLGVDRRKNLADGCAAAIGGDQDRHLFIRQAALAGLAATLARLAIQSARSLVALKHVSLVNFDNALEFRPILACGLQETVPPAEGRIDAKSASTGRFPYRLALGQRHAE